MCRQSVVHHQLISSFEKIVVSNKTLYWLNILDSEEKIQSGRQNALEMIKLLQEQ